MTRKTGDTSKPAKNPIRRRTVLSGAAAATVAAAVPLRFAHSQGQKLKIGTLYPKSGIQAQIGIDCMRGIAVAAEVLKQRGGYPEFEIIEGEYAGRKVWARLNLENPNETAVAIARGDLSAICRAVGVLTPNDSDELHDIPLVIKVVAKKRQDTGELTNEIKGYLARDKAEKPVSMAALILEVPDMDKAIAAIVAAGGKGGKVNKSGEGLSYAMVADNEGNPIELLLKQ